MTLGNLIMIGNKLFSKAKLIFQGKNVVIRLVFVPRYLGVIPGSEIMCDPWLYSGTICGEKDSGKPG